MYLSGIEFVLFVIGLVLCGILCTLGCMIAIDASRAGRKRREPISREFDLSNPINRNAMANQTPETHEDNEWYLREWRNI